MNQVLCGFTCKLGNIICSNSTETRTTQQKKKRNRLLPFDKPPEHLRCQSTIPIGRGDKKRRNNISANTTTNKGIWAATKSASGDFNYPIVDMIISAGLLPHSMYIPKDNTGDNNHNDDNARENMGVKHPGLCKMNPATPSPPNTGNSNISNQEDCNPTTNHHGISLQTTGLLYASSGQTSTTDPPATIYHHQFSTFLSITLYSVYYHLQVH